MEPFRRARGHARNLHMQPNWLARQLIRNLYLPLKVAKWAPGAIGAYAYGKYYGTGKTKRVSRSYGRMGSRRKALMYSKPKTKIQRLDKKVKRLQQYSAANMGTLTYRSTGSVSLQAAVAVSNDFTVGQSTLALIETVLAQLRYYNPSAPANLTTADFTTGTYQKEVLLRSASTVLYIVNNNQVPVQVSVYTCSVKRDTNFTVESIFGAIDSDMSNVTTTSPFLYPSDIPAIDDLWTINKTTKCILQPGRNKVLIMSSNKMVNYDPSLSDSHNLQNQKAFDSKQFYIRINGVLAHDSAADEQAFINAGVDIRWKTTYKVQYNAGANIKFVFVDDNMNSSFTNGGQVSNKPVSGQQQYSV